MLSAIAAVTLMIRSVPAENNPFKAEMVSIEVAAKRASGCGLGPVTFHHDSELDGDVLTLGSARTATDAQLACVDKAAGLNFVDAGPELQERFFKIRNDRFEAIMLAGARKWLADRGLLERVPKYVAGQTDDTTFTQEVETLCGPHATGAFKSRFGPNSVSPDWASRPPSADQMEAFACIMKVSMVSGYKLGFVGNEAYVEPPKEHPLSTQSRQ